MKTEMKEESNRIEQTARQSACRSSIMDRTIKRQINVH